MLKIKLGNKDKRYFKILPKDRYRKKQIKKYLLEIF
jgi:hypothetical protein